MSTTQNINNLKRVVTKKIRQTVRRLEKNLENLGKLAEPVPEAARIPVPVRIPVPPSHRSLYFKTCLWQSILPCITQLAQLFSGVSCHKQTFNHSFNPDSLHRPGPTHLMKAGFRNSGTFPKSALFGSSISQTIALSMYGTRLATAGFSSEFHSTRFYSTYSNFSGGRFNHWSWAKINNSMMFKQFSSRTQFTLQKFLTYYRLPTLTQILKKRSRNAYGEWEPRVRIWNICRELTKNAQMAGALAKTTTSTALRLDALLTQGFHDMVRVLANEASTVAEGCYVDFKLQPLVFIPEKTMMTPAVLAELLNNLRQFERHLAQLQRDLSLLSDLGELPLRFVANEGVIRVYFPNCDRERLQILLREKNICSGVIYEDFAQEAHELDRFSNVSTVSENDILSSYYSSLVESSSQSGDSDVLSFETSSSAFEKNSPGNMLPVHLENLEPNQGGPIVFAEDSYCWA